MVNKLITPKVYGIRIKGNTGSLKLMESKEDLKRFEEQIINELKELKGMLQHFENKKETYQKIAERLKEEAKAEDQDTVKRCFIEIEQTENTISKIKKQLKGMKEAELVTIEQNRNRSQRLIKIAKMEEIYKDWDCVCFA